ncbi:putative bifunctional diguanylate cyclase/phosphodiesterase [Neorhodopirellula pilleata]|uniref:Phytochrome-like protein cph2 n=1 Tax=Neorhodopirellula pilleata TaxID=2714738 RepID=A0A5C6AV70_9BACT|nr:EAL domain-containing protein [Neorhodopirellula pilleata]TWU03915.1 Phytochrome-like protein cph2 [Neorhodopirellula pilleata]
MMHSMDRLTDRQTKGDFLDRRTLVGSDANESWTDCLPFGLCRFDSRDRLVHANALFGDLYDAPSDLRLEGQSIGQIIGLIDRRDVRDAMTDAFASPGVSRIWQTADGRHIAVTCRVQRDGGWVMLHEDIGRFQNESADLSRLACLDALTGLMNRHAFTKVFSARVETMSDDQEIAILYIDLDHFKPINDMYGHPIGDEVLVAVADRIQQLCQHGELIARVGGDEFVIMQADQHQPSSSRRLGNQIIESLNDVFIIDGQPLFLGASIGVAIAPYDADNSEDLVKNADLALYGAKSYGRSVLRYFEPKMESAMRTRRVLETELRLAIESDGFELNYQPVMDLEANRIVSFEALIRWPHPTMGPMRPDQFIPLAEETGLIVPIGEWVLREACKEAVRWSEDIGLAVNISPVQLRDRRLFQVIHNALKESGLAPERLELEITENALIAETDLTLGLLHQIRDLGVRIAMDDFGTGYSSINYLRKFPFDKIKIDRSFVTGSDQHSESTALVKMIASLGIGLGVRTTAEGVETCGEMESVRAAGCSEIQGYFLSKPITADAVMKLLAQDPQSYAR